MVLVKFPMTLEKLFLIGSVDLSVGAITRVSQGCDEVCLRDLLEGIP